MYVYIYICIHTSRLLVCTSPTNPTNLLRPLVILLVIGRWQETFALLTLAVAALSKVQLFVTAALEGGI